MSKQKIESEEKCDIKRIIRNEADLVFKKVTVETQKFPRKNMNHLIKKGDFIQRTKLRNLDIKEPLQISISFDLSKISKIEYAFSGSISIDVNLYYESEKNFVTGRKKSSW